MKRTKPYLSVVLIALLALLCGCVAEDFADLDDRPLNEDVGADLDSSAGDAGGGGADVEDDAVVIECETSADCADDTNANQTGVCQTSSGTCRFPCNGGYLDCDGVHANGCEIDSTNDVTNCGVCDKVCEPKATNLMPICVEGGCESDPDQCVDGFVDVDEAVAGCECEIMNADDEPGDGEDTNCDGVD